MSDRLVKLLRNKAVKVSNSLCKRFRASGDGKLFKLIISGNFPIVGLFYWMRMRKVIRPIHWPLFASVFLKNRKRGQCIGLGGY